MFRAFDSIQVLPLTWEELRRTTTRILVVADLCWLCTTLHNTSICSLFYINFLCHLSQINVEYYYYYYWFVHLLTQYVCIAVIYSTCNFMEWVKYQRMSTRVVVLVFNISCRKWNLLWVYLRRLYISYFAWVKWRKFI